MNVNSYILLLQLHFEHSFHSLHRTHTLSTQLRNIPNGLPFAEQTYYFPIFGFHLFFRLY